MKMQKYLHIKKDTYHQRKDNKITVNTLKSLILTFNINCGVIYKNGIPKNS